MQDNYAALLMSLRIAKAEGYLDEHQAAYNVDRLHSVSLDFKLTKYYSAETTVRVTDSQGRPIQGAVISSEQIAPTVRTDRNGITRVRLFSRIELMATPCSIAADGYATRSAWISPRQLQNDVVLYKPRVLTGLVMTMDGKPISEACVSDSGGIRERTKTDRQGRFVLRIPDARGHDLIASADGYVNKRIWIGEQDRELVIKMDPTNARGGIFGRVVDPEGNPVWKFMVNAISKENETDSTARFVENIDGVFLIADLPEGRFTFYFRYTGYDGSAFRMSTGEITIIKGQVFGPLAIVCNRLN
jgi:hypothetical protein